MRLTTILEEDDAPFIRRLRHIVNTERDPVMAFCILDAIIGIGLNKFRRPRCAYTCLGLEKAREQLISDISSLIIMQRITDQGGSRRPTPAEISNYRNDIDQPQPTDEQILEEIKRSLGAWLDAGTWYDDEEIPTRSPFEKMTVWMANVVRRDDINQIATMLKKGVEIADWVGGTRPQLDKFTPTTALAASEKWHKEMLKKQKERDEDPKFLKRVATIPYAMEHVDKEGNLTTDPVNGEVEVFELSPGQLVIDGGNMGHCTASAPSYREGIQSGRAMAFSIRHNMQRRFTAYFDKVANGWRLQQIKGNSNRCPGDSYKPEYNEAAIIALKWFAEQGYDVGCGDTTWAMGQIAKRKTALSKRKGGDGALDQQLERWSRHAR